MRSLVFTLLILAHVAAAGSAFGSVLWNETTNGDLSGDWLNPTQLTPLDSSNTISAKIGGGTGGSAGDRDFFTLNVPAGRQLSAIMLTTFTPSGGVSFMGVQSGNQITMDPDNPNATLLLGFAHFGAAELNTNILDDMGSVSVAIGFTPPLPAGAYSFWVQELSGSRTFAMDFQTTPVPGSVALIGPAAALLLRRGRPIRR